MKVFTYRIAVTGIIVAMLLPVAGANAQLGDLLKQGESSGSSSGSSGGMGSLGAAGGALSGQSITSGSTGNVAGVLEYCIKNNYVSGSGASGASAVKDKLMGKLPGGSSTSDHGYSEGAKGLLHSSDGKQIDLSGGGMKAGVTKQVCEQVLSQAKSLL